MDEEVQLSNTQLRQVYTWIDSVPLSRPKRNITRDFSDGVLMAEVVHHFFPKSIDMHNYIKSSSVSQKLVNWQTLNHRVFRRMSFVIHDDDITEIINQKKGAIERVLLFVQHQFASMDNYQETTTSNNLNNTNSFNTTNSSMNMTKQKTNHQQPMSPEKASIKKQPFTPDTARQPSRSRRAGSQSRLSLSQSINSHDSNDLNDHFNDLTISNTNHNAGNIGNQNQTPQKSKSRQKSQTRPQSDLRSVSKTRKSQATYDANLLNTSMEHKSKRQSENPVKPSLPEVDSRTFMEQQPRSTSTVHTRQPIMTQTQTPLSMRKNRHTDKSVHYEELLAQKDMLISDLQETIDVLEEKVATLDKILKLKDSKIASLAERLDRHMN